MAALGGALSWWTVNRDLPVEVISRTVLTPEIKPGGDLLIRREVFRAKDCPTQVDRFIIDANGRRWILEDQDFASFGKLGLDTYTTATPTPPSMAEGKATYSSATTYRCNPVQEFFPLRTRSPPIEFLVKR